MNKSRLFTFAVLALTLVLGWNLVSCGDSDSGDPTSPPPPTKVILGAGSPGTAGDKTITDLTSGKTYAVLTGGKWYGVKADKTLGDTGGKDSPDLIADAAPLSAGSSAIIGLSNGVTYFVYEVKTVAASYAVPYNTLYGPLVDNTEAHAFTAAANVKTGTSLVIITPQNVTASSPATILTTSGGVVIANDQYIQVASGTNAYYLLSNVTAGGAKISGTSGKKFFSITGITAATTVTITGSPSAP
ncbi:MAG: hypothetical protein LBG84_10005 [Treponema sp.]|jgi:hypothetical protein|nr:hypothetical protein [Treponema sp.]